MASIRRALISVSDKTGVVDMAKGLAGRGMKAYVFFNNHFSAQGVANAVQLRRQLGDPVPEPLPPALVEHFPWLDAK